MEVNGINSCTTVIKGQGEQAARLHIPSKSFVNASLPIVSSQLSNSASLNEGQL